MVYKTMAHYCYFKYGFQDAFVKLWGPSRFCLQNRENWIFKMLVSIPHNLTQKKFKITTSGKKQSRSTAPDFVQMLL
jgi:hypothetical protein